MRKRILQITLLSFSLILSFLNVFADNESEPKIGTVDGRQLYCIFDFAPQIFVKIDIPPNYQRNIEKFQVEWYEVGSSNIHTKEIAGTMTPDPFLIPFNLSDLFEDCLPDKRFDVTLYTYIKNELEPVNNGFKITFRKAPESRFIYDTVAVCSKTPAVLNGSSSCPSSITKYEWQIEGKTYTGPVIQYEFSGPGTYPIRLITENECGLDTLIQQLNVVHHPLEDVAVATALEDGVNNFCLGDDGIHEVMIDASATKNYNSFTWKVTGDTRDYNIVDTEHPGKKRFQFQSAGRYQIILQISMRCNYQYLDTFYLNIIGTPELELMHLNTACGQYEFVPSTRNPAGTIYFINGILTESFPYIIDTGEHVLKAQYNDICGLVETEKKFLVMDPDEIQNPLISQQLTVCLQDGKIVFHTSHPLAEIESVSGLTKNVNNEYEFRPTRSGIFVFNEYLGDDACLFRTTITVKVSELINTLTDMDFCAGKERYPIPVNLRNGVLEIDGCSDCIAGDYFDFSQTTDKQFTIRYSVENSDGCKVTKQATLRIVDPIAEFVLTGLPCLSNVEVLYNKDLASTFNWVVNSSENKASFNNLRDQLKNGSNTISLLASIGQCTDTLTQTFDIVEEPVEKAIFELSQPACSPYHLNPDISAPLSAQHSYSWSIEYDNKTEKFNSYQIPVNYFLNANVGETKTVSVIYTVENVCGIDTHRVTLDVLNQPVAQIGISPSKEACEVLPAILTNRSYGTIDNAVWEFDQKKINSKDLYFEHTFIAKDTTTFFPVKLTVSNHCGEHAAYDTIKIIIPKMDAFYSADNFEICPGESIAFKDASVPLPNQWRWDFGDGTTSTQSNPVHSFDGQKESYQVTLYASTGCGWDTISQTVQIKSHPLVDFTIPPVICSGETSISVSGHSIQNGQDYTWFIGQNEPVSNILRPVLYFEESGIQHVILKIQDLFSLCISELTKNIDVREKPDADFIIDSTHCLDESLTVSNLSTNASHYSWLLDNTPITNVFSPKVEIAEMGYHLLTLVAFYEDFCTDTISKRFLVKRCGYYIPNAFTPDNDGVDDYFTIYGANELAKIKSLQIFNRWGQLVFEKNNFLPNIDQEGWDGSFQNKNNNHQLGPQVFIYQVRLLYEDGEEELVSGDITLIR